MSVIKFKYLKNHMIDIGDGKQYAINVDIREREVNSPHGYGSPTRALMPYFHMDTQVHTVELPNCEPSIPNKRAEWSDTFFSRIKDRAYEDALKAREAAAKIIAALRRYSSSAGLNVIQIVEDNDGILADETLELSTAEKGLIAESKAERINPKTAKPSELARAAGAK